MIAWRQAVRMRVRRRGTGEWSQVCRPLGPLGGCRRGGARAIAFTQAVAGIARFKVADPALGRTEEPAAVLPRASPNPRVRGRLASIAAGDGAGQ